MIHTLSRKSLQALMEIHSAPCISLYMPTDRTGVDRQQDQMRIRRLIREIKSLLSDQEPLNAALIGDEQFWLHMSDGLAIFRSPEVFYTYRLPTGFNEKIVVGNHFHLKPLLPLLTNDGRSTSWHSPTTGYDCSHALATAPTNWSCQSRCRPVSPTSSSLRSGKTTSNGIARPRSGAWAKAGGNRPSSTDREWALMRAKMSCCATSSTSIADCTLC